MNSITCTKCGAVKPSGDFYLSLIRQCGTVGQCKQCTKARVTQHRAETLETVRAYDRARSVEPHRIDNATRVTRQWRRKHPDRQAAHNKAARAGLEAPTLCEGCKGHKKLEKHHPDYSKPLLVVWLCKPCHVIADKIRRRLEAS